ncbi:hypothetical protein J6590_067722 [Homalodisca vitripennis]|nr:hypothetical protein J6590_067722 [Homalodisca vitripennis]
MDPPLVPLPPSPRRRGFSMIHLNIPVGGWTFNTPPVTPTPGVSVTPATPPGGPPRKFSFANLRRLSASTCGHLIRVPSEFGQL